VEKNSDATPKQTAKSCLNQKSNPEHKPACEIPKQKTPHKDQKQPNTTILNYCNATGYGKAFK
jgi:hypothetical protein